jgi:hypothetical protein
MIDHIDRFMGGSSVQQRCCVANAIREMEIGARRKVDVAIVRWRFPVHPRIRGQAPPARRQD